MKLAELTWKDVDALFRDIVVIIPTGSLEQHGPHLPLFTDSLLVTSVAEAIENRISDKVLLLPTLWLGASAHHLKFPGTLDAGFEAYIGAIESVIESLLPHQFHRFFVLNGHGGNISPNDLSLRGLKRRHPNITCAHAGYSDFATDEIAKVLDGPIKRIIHACEAETSLMMHLHPDKVRVDKIRNDGLSPVPTVSSLLSTFDEITEEGSFGYSTLASAQKGERIFDAAVNGATTEIERIHGGIVLVGSEPLGKTL